MATFTVAKPAATDLTVELKDGAGLSLQFSIAEARNVGTLLRHMADPRAAGSAAYTEGTDTPLFTGLSWNGRTDEPES